jgi:diguanylate cyclase (GGDEF)-like protein/PAS domain S-box-containing protein
MASASPMFDDMGNFLGLLGMLVDVTERKRAEERLRLAAEVFNSTAESIVILDADRTVVEVNRAFTTVTGYAPLEVAGRKPWQTWLQDKAFFDEAMATLATQDHWRGETHNRRKAGDIYPELLNVSVVRDGSGKPAHYILVCSDITDLKSSQERLEYLASHDRLTGLPNRGLFYDRLQHGLQKAMRRRESLAVMFVDLDNFKIINDTLGHEMGDLLLGQVADRLRSCTRKGDTVARLGGDEFTVLAEDLQEPEDVVSATARRIIDTLSQPFNLDGHEVLTSASVGISLYPENGENLSTLLKNADTAMYRAKQEGKNNFQFFTVDMNVHANERAILEKGLRLALENGEMFLTYQPQVETGTGRVVGLEALLRWRHPGLGLVPPEKFIPVAESSGLIVPIGEWVLDTVCRQVRTWTWQGLDRFRVAVNLSFRQFRQKDLAEAIRGTIGERGIDPANLEIELTESSVMEDADQAGRVLRQLKDMGVRIAIDDFGMGYSSLNYLKRLPIDRLKIDSHFTRDIASNPDDAASMQMAVVAEGVETREQMDFLRARSCDFVQGFYVGRPLPAKEAAETLRLASL